MGATSDGARRALLVLNNQFVDYISAVHATTSHIARRLTGSAPIHEFFSHQVPSASDAHMPLTDHALFVLGGDSIPCSLLICERAEAWLALPKEIIPLCLPRDVPDPRFRHLEVNLLKCNGRFVKRCT